MMRELRAKQSSYRPTAVPMPVDPYAPEPPEANLRNAAQIVRFAIDEARGLTFDESVAVMKRVDAAIEQLETTPNRPLKSGNPEGSK